MEVDPSALFAIFFCILASALFSAAETAVASLGALFRHSLKENSSSSMRLLLMHPSRVFTVILLFDNLSKIAATVLAADISYRLTGSVPVSALIATVTVVMLILSSIIPKAIARAHPQIVAQVTMVLINLLYRATYPLIVTLASFATWIIRILGSEQNLQPTITEEELEYLIEVGEKTGAIEEVKKEMISGVFDFDETKVREIMTPRTDIVAVEKDTSLEETIRLIIQSGHSRLPVYDEQIDNVMGIVFAKDVLRYMADPKRAKANLPFTLKSLMREPQFVPESKHLIEIFKELKQSKNHMAIIIDEYGGTAGLVTMEDILEEIVGDIQDEFDTEEASIVEVSENVYDVAGYVNISEFAEFFEIDEAIAKDVEGEVDTIAGWMTQILGHLPEIGQKVSYGSLTLEVTEVDRHRIDRLRVVQAPKPEQPITEISG